MKTIKELTIAIACIAPLVACGGGGGNENNNNPVNAGNINTENTSTNSNASTTGGGNSGTSSNAQTSYLVTPSISSNGGIINPSTAVSVQSSSATSFQVTPSAGYTATVGGTCGGSLSGTTYTTKAITANCTVVATFSKPLTFSYEDPSYSDGVPGPTLTQINQEGAKSYRFLGNGLFISMIPSQSGSSSGTLLMDSIFVKDDAALSYTYEQLAYPQDNSGNVDVTALINQASTEGAKGYLYQGQSLYRKDGSAPITYTYMAAPAPASLAAWLAQANEQGQSGYWFYGWIGSSALYIKNNASISTYAYDALPQPSTSGDLLTQLNTEGKKGYRVLSLPYFTGQWNTTTSPDGGNFYMSLGYIKDQTQIATFTYFLDTATAFSKLNFSIDPLNSHGAYGNAYLGNIAIPNSTQSVSTENNGTYNPVSAPPGADDWIVWPVYFNTNHCSGFLCTVLDRMGREY